jgi:hypothetical protein
MENETFYKSKRITFSKAEGLLQVLLLTKPEEYFANHLASHVHQ